jgi:hypothetical protein
MRRSIAVVICGAAVGLGACSSSVGSTNPDGRLRTPVTTTTMSTVALGHEVLTILNNEATAVDTGTTEPGPAGYSMIASAYNNAAQQLQSLDYPAGARSDAKALVAILQKLVDDVPSSGGGVTAEMAPQYAERDLTTETNDSNALRHDLGLPPGGEV